MIGFLQGSIWEKHEKSLVLMTPGGVGYEVFTPLGTLSMFKKGQNIDLWIYTKVSENEISLYGFEDLTQKHFFEKLIGISGIGPKIGLQILSGPVDPFLKAVEQGDHVYIAQTPGIGKKMAQKIIVELQGKLDLSASAPINNSQQEAVQALEGLGYSKGDVLEILKGASEDLDSEGLVKYFLQSKV